MKPRNTPWHMFNKTQVKQNYRSEARALKHHAQAKQNTLCFESRDQKNRAQATIEFVTLIGFMFFIFTLFAALLHTRTNQVSQANDRMKMNEIAKIIVTETNLAETVGDGYSRIFELPYSLSGFDYNTTIQDQQDLVLAYKEQQFIYFLHQKIFGQPSKGKNLITNKGTLINVSAVG